MRVNNISNYFFNSPVPHVPPDNFLKVYLRASTWRNVTIDQSLIFVNLSEKPIPDDSEAEVAPPDKRRRQGSGFRTVDSIHEEGIVQSENWEKTGKKAGKKIRPLQSDGKRNSQPYKEKATESIGPSSGRFGS